LSRRQLRSPGTEQLCFRQPSDRQIQVVTSQNQMLADRHPVQSVPISGCIPWLRLNAS